MGGYLPPALGQTPERAPQKFETWTGGEAFGRVWSLYAGGNYAVFGGVAEDGLRLRALAGYSKYSYASRRWTGASVQSFQFRGATTFADVLAGYHKQLGTLTIKVLGGITLAERTSDDPEASAGTEIGGKAVLETWWNITDRTWTSLDLSWTTLDDVYGARARLGWRALPELSLGLEGSAVGGWDYQTTRVGGFVRYEWSRGEVSLSGGIAQDGGRGSIDLPGAYVTFGMLTRF